jgi:hypothetical protein
MLRYKLNEYKNKISVHPFLSASQKDFNSGAPTLDTFFGGFEVIIETASPAF